MRRLFHVISVIAVTATVILLFSGFSATRSKEEYQILNPQNDMGKNPQALQAELNHLGEQGWKVRTSIGSWIVLAKEK